MISPSSKQVISKAKIGVAQMKLLLTSCSAFQEGIFAQEVKEVEDQMGSRTTDPLSSDIQTCILKLGG
jgi:hypothetical protein